MPTRRRAACESGQWIKREFWVIAKLRTIAWLFAVTSVTGVAAWAQETEKRPSGVPPPAKLPARGPEKGGLASLYPGDKGIEKDKDVVFAESFEADSVGALAGRWNQFNTKLTTLVDDVPLGSAGKKSVLFTHVGGQSEGGHLYKCFKPGFDQLFLRFYVKFDPDCAPIHHFVHMGGYNPPTPWPQGGAGTRPKGNERFTTGVEPYGNSWQWDFYSYWMEMRGSPPRGQTWGNCFLGDAKPKAEKGKWQCAELMMKLNDVGDSNGEQALWIDGKLAGHLGKGFPKGKWTFDRFLPGQGGDCIRWNDQKGDSERFRVAEGGEPFEGFRWRNSDGLRLNFLWMLVYITKAPEGHVSKIGFDNIVLARKYIGPLATGKVRTSR